MDNEPRKEVVRRAQKILVRLRVKIQHPPQGPPLLIGRVGIPNAPCPLPLAFSRPFQPHPRPASRPSLLLRKPGERTTPRPAASGHARWRDRLRAGRARPPSARAAAAPAATAAAHRPRTPLGAARASLSGTS